MTAIEWYRELRARGICANCRRADALVPRAYCADCQRRRDYLRRQREGWKGGVRPAPSVAAVVAPEPVAVPQPEPQPRPRKVVTLRPPHLGRDVEFEVVFP